MSKAFQVVRDFEKAVADYTGAPYAVAVNSCTNALFLSLMYHKKIGACGAVEIPRYTYISVPMQIKHAGFNVTFRDENWKGMYQLNPFNIWDAARRFTKDMFTTTNFVSDEQPIDYICISFHWSKILGIQQGGMILHNDSEFDVWARKARFDGRTEGVLPKDEDRKKMQLGYHCYMSPEIAAEGLVRLSHLPNDNTDLPNDAYPDLSEFDIFK